ncbi:MAG TPA: non-homologous end-joining DNA ligase [Streptosporangiaceae bacterium]|nr:non-homologous end-joining DNA ligase [Streptosporangiaceae bacterium]
MIDRDSPGARRHIRPMLATAGELPADDAGWAYEMKWDGLRAIGYVAHDSVTLRSRSDRDITSGYPELQGIAAATGHAEAVLDGEIVAFGENGWPSFEVLQQRMNSPLDQVRLVAAEISVSYLAFDLLVLDGEPLFGQPYRQRRERLEQLALDGQYWQTPPAFTGLPGADVQVLSRQHSLEGVMAKRLESRYEPGRRSTSWIKIKNVRRQEVVVGGWKPGTGARSGQIGSLLVGVQEPAGLVYAGHVGTGFSQQTLRLLGQRLTPLVSDASPFATPVPAEHAGAAVWVRPVVVIEVTFAEWTSAGRLRAATYQGLRTDKDPAEVVREPA